MLKRLIPLATVAALGLTLAGCPENEPAPADGGGGGATMDGGTAIDVDNDGMIERGEPGFVDRDGDGVHDGNQGRMKLPDVGEPETPNEPIGPRGE
jgi:hypothetical protein